MVIQQKLRVLIPLCGRLRQPVGGLLFVLYDLVASEIQFAESILGVLVPMFSGSNQISFRFHYIFENHFPLEIQFSQMIPSGLVSRIGSLLVADYRLVHSSLFLEERSQGIPVAVAIVL